MGKKLIPVAAVAKGINHGGKLLFIPLAVVVVEVEDSS